MTAQVPSHQSFATVTGSQVELSRPWFGVFSIWAKRLVGIEMIAPVAAADAATAPAAYSQAHMNTVITELNETKAQLNALLAAGKVN